MKKQRLTSVKMALEWTRDLWAWLARNPGAEKHEWPGWETRQKCRYGCPCCQVVKQKCGKCPLLALWGNTKAWSRFDGSPCTILDESPFAQWFSAHSFPFKGFRQKARAAARKISQAAAKKLENL